MSCIHHCPKLLKREAETTFLLSFINLHSQCIDLKWILTFPDVQKCS